MAVICHPHLLMSFMDKDSPSRDNIHRWRFHLWMRFLHPLMPLPSVDDIHGWYFHPWMRFVHPCMELSFVTFWSHRLPIIGKITPKLCKTWAESDRWQFHPWMRNFIHGWRNLIHGWKCHRWMRMTYNGHRQSHNLGQGCFLLDFLFIFCHVKKRFIYIVTDKGKGRFKWPALVTRS